MKMRRRELTFNGCVICALALLFAMPFALPAQASGASQDDTVYDLSKEIKPPKPVSTPNPEYSEKARKQKISGTVLVEMIVQSDGSVRDVQVLKSLEKSLDQQAVAAVSKWKFEPATKDGTPVAVRIKTELTFRTY